MGGIVNRDLKPADEGSIESPSHYKHGAIEPIDVIEDWKVGPHLANVIKYVARADHKGTPLEDLIKARWYLEREIWRRTRDGQ